MANNPFTTGPLRNTYQHYGRRQQIQHFVEEQKNIVLIGNRRSGKTWLLIYLEKLLLDHSESWGVFVDLQGNISSLEMGREVMRRYMEYPQTHKKKIKPVKPEAIHLFEVIEHLNYECSHKNSHGYILLDEAEELLNLSEAELGKLRSTIYHSKYLNVILAGSRRLFELFTKPVHTSPFLYGFDQYFLSALTAQDISALIRQEQHPEVSIPMDPESLAELQNKCGCQPFLIQRTCLYLFQNDSLNLQELGRYLINDRFLESCFQNDFDSLSFEQQQILLQASFSEAKDVITFSSLTGIKNARTKSDLDELHQLGMLKSPNKGKYQLENYFLAQWVTQKKESLTVDFKKHIRQLVATDKIKQAVKELLLATEQNRQAGLHDDVILLSSKLQQQLTARARGTLNDREYQVEMAKIKESLLYYLDLFAG